MPKYRHSLSLVVEPRPSALPAPAVGSKEAEDLHKSLELSQPASKATDFAHLSSAFAESLEDHVVREQANLAAAVSESRQSYDAAVANSLEESLEQNGRPRFGGVLRFCSLVLGIRAGQYSAKKLERWTGQMGFVASVNPDCRVDLQALRSKWANGCRKSASENSLGP
eukprot:COSAG01_NODE_25479_length_743_cov_4.085404_1_plen_168_part_00